MHLEASIKDTFGTQQCYRLSQVALKGQRKGVRDEKGWPHLTFSVDREVQRSRSHLQPGLLYLLGIALCYGKGKRYFEETDSGRKTCVPTIFLWITGHMCSVCVKYWIILFNQYMADPSSDLSLASSQFVVIYCSVRCSCGREKVPLIHKITLGTTHSQDYLYVSSRSKHWSWADGLVGKVLVTQAWGLEFDPQHLHRRIRHSGASL